MESINFLFNMSTYNAYTKYVKKGKLHIIKFLNIY